MKIAALMLAAALGMAGGQAGLFSAAHQPVLPTARVQSNAQRRAVRSGSLQHLTGGTRRGPGWSYAHVKRMAAKARNVARHRARCKGRR